ncbi:MAG: DM13 domain-containing protein [Thermoplasmata archaeon]|nr:DM13 domain-containing protein [Thermoplasmata archaeon]
MAVSRIKLLLVLVIVAALAVPAWILASPLFLATVGTDESPTGFTSLVASGTFRDGEPGHVSSGEARLLHDGSSYVLRFENFFVTNGPGLNVYLTFGPRVAPGDLDLGPLKASQGDSNYLLPDGVDPHGFRYVVIWCVPFAVQFGFAPLTFA